jgi:hypothetical protein
MHRCTSTPSAVRANRNKLDAAISDAFMNGFDNVPGSVISDAHYGR